MLHNAICVWHRLQKRNVSEFTYYSAISACKLSSNSGYSVQMHDAYTSNVAVGVAHLAGI